MADTYLYFVAGYIAFWLIFFGTSACVLKKLGKLEKKI